MVYRPMTKNEKSILARATDLGVVPAVVGTDRSTFINELRRNPRAAEQAIAAAAATEATRRPMPVAAGSVKSTDKRPAPAKVGSERRPSPKPGAKPGTKIGVERIAPVSNTTRAEAPAPTPTLIPTPAATPPTGYPSFWRRGRSAGVAGTGRGHRATTITAAGTIGAQRATQPRPAPGSSGTGVHAMRDTTRLIAAEAARQTAQVASAQRGRTGHYDPHNLIAGSGGNAQRLRAAEQAELQRMADERSRRGY